MAKNLIARADRHETQINFRATKEQIQEWTKAAKAAGLTRADWIRITLGAAASRKPASR